MEKQLATTTGPAGEEREPAAMLRILHVLAPGEVGGLERVVQSLARAQAAVGHEVHVAPILDRGRKDHPFLTPLRDGPVMIHARESRARDYPGDARFVRALCRRIEPDVVHTHGYRADVVAGWAARREGAATATTVHGFTGGGAKNRFYEWLQLHSYRRFHAVVAVSRPLAESLRQEGVRRQRLHLLPNAWSGPSRPPLGRTEARARLDLPAEDVVLGWIGRLSAEKGPDVFLDALAEAEDAGVLAAVIGDGHEREPLEERARRLGLSARIRWCGRVEDAGRLLPAFDVLVLSSRTEGTPMVLFEAMEAEVPVVATEVGGVPDVLSRKEAVLVPPESPAALAAAIRTVLEDRAAAAARARRAREKLRRKFDPQPWVARYVALYRTAVEQAREET